MAHHFVCTGPITQNAADLLRQHGEVLASRSFTREALLPLLPNATALVVRGVEVKIDSALLDAAPRLKAIGRTGAGYDNIDIAAATGRGIPVLYAPGVNARAVAEAALAFMLTLCKKIRHFDAELKRNNWRSRFEMAPEDLNGRTLGIVGFGAIGKMVARLAAPFNMKLFAYDPYAKAVDARRLGTELVELEVLLEHSDFVTIHASLTNETLGLINAERLKRFKPGAYLLNLARGGIIASLDCLYEALVDGRLAGVGLDVFDPEPPDISHPIFQHPGCLATPHAVAITQQAMEAICQVVAEDIVAVLNRRPPRYIVNPEVIEAVIS